MNVVFVAAARKSIRRSERGIVGMIIKDAVVPDGNPITIYKEKDIPETLSTENKEQIKLAMKGNDTTPRKIVVYVLAKTEEDYRKALEYFEIKKVTWLCCPTVKTDGQEEEIVTWVRDQREGNRNKIKAVLPDNTADSEGIVNYATSEVTVKGKKYGPEEFCSRIAVLCGHRIFPVSPVKFPSPFLTFHPECFVMPDVLSDAKTAVFPSRHLTVQEFLMKTEALIWSLQTMCFFTVKISLLYAARFNVCSLRTEN